SITMSYQQLGEGQRYLIPAHFAQGVSVSATAQAIVVHRSTLYRERRRNAHQEGYLPIWRISKRTFI
ncbi:helix-turn-helix domain-containing protein, partial [Vibrio sp. 1078-1]|uniref:helix-turn-helix domain-containing protein n=1 Tax=Vibrio sp. 1078-1 TaxID=3074544 RepID=UPI00398CB6BB